MIESETELKNLAAVPYQIISPANNKSIVGIFQDSLLGTYQFTRQNIKHFTKKETMNLINELVKILMQTFLKQIISLILKF